ncbi:hypothetical protein OROGR_031089 [Orobanche gracilis]
MMPQMEDKYQIYVIVSTFTLHNFMRMCKLGITVLEHDVVEGGVDNDLLNSSRKEDMNKLRKEITLRIWRSIPGNVETAREQERNIELGDHLEQDRQVTWKLIERNEKALILSDFYFYFFYFFVFLLNIVVFAVVETLSVFVYYILMSLNPHLFWLKVAVMTFDNVGLGTRVYHGKI